MNEAHVISVDPGVKTLGEICVNNQRLARISRTLSAPGRRVVAPFRKIMNILFGINQKVNNQFSGKMMLLRFVCGVLFVASVLVPMDPASILDLQFGVESAMLVGVGISLVLGLFTRLTALAGAVVFGFQVYVALTAGIVEAMPAAIMMLMLFFSVMGPGLYSVDSLMRKGLIKLSRTRARARKPVAFDYRAYTIIDRRIG